MIVGFEIRPRALGRFRGTGFCRWFTCSRDFGSDRMSSAAVADVLICGRDAGPVCRPRLAACGDRGGGLMCTLGPEHVVSQSPTVAVPRLDGAVPPAALTGDVLETDVVGVGRAVDDAAHSATSTGPVGSSSGTERIVIGLNICFEGEGAGALFGLVLSDLLERVPEQLRGLDRVGVTALARVDGGDR